MAQEAGTPGNIPAPAPTAPSPAGTPGAIPAPAPSAPAPSGELGELPAGFSWAEPPPGEEGVQEPPAAPTEGTPPAVEAEIPPAEPEPVEDPLARTREDLERRDRELLERNATLRARETQLQEFEEIRQLAQTDPLGAMRRMGGDPLRAAEQVLAGDEEPDSAAKIKGLEAKLDQFSQQLQDQQIEQARGREYANIRAAIDASGDRLPVLRATAAEGDDVIERVFQQAADHYQRTNQAPNMAQILEKTEAQFTDQVFASLSSLIAVPSIKERLIQQLNPTQKPVAPAQKPLPPAGNGIQPTQPGQGLSTDMAGESSTEVRYLSDEEAEAEFERALREGVERKP